ncbi:MAG TPA: hypothetical protein VK942_12040, partial [Actinomycetes bacterium]|nr:hypothetical protein [Actinomycetes bacterium]
VPRVIGLLVLAGLAMAAATRLRVQRSTRDGTTTGGPAAAAWALALAWPVGVYAMVASYDGNGGHTHPRYLFPGLAVLAVVAALGLDRLPGGRRGLWLMAVPVAQLALTGAAWAGLVTALAGRRPDDPADLLGAVARLLEAGGLARPWLLLAPAGAVLLAGLALLVLAVGWTAPAGTADDAVTDTGRLEGSPDERIAARAGGSPAGLRGRPGGGAATAGQPPGP